MLVFGLAGCGSTLEGAKADIYDTRKAISDFVKPSETSVAITVANTPKKEKAVD
jgi:predicted small secreted protein